MTDSSRWRLGGILLFGGCLVACSTLNPGTAPPITLSPDQQTLLMTSADPVTPRRFTLKNLPTESRIAPGLYFHPKRFSLIQVSPDGRFVAFSTVDHHALVGLLNLVTMMVREIDVITEGEVLNFHWAADGRMLAYDYLPASGYQRVRGYDLESGEGLVLSHPELHPTTHLAFERWGLQPREMIIRTREKQTDAPQVITVTLSPSKQLAPSPQPRQ